MKVLHSYYTSLSLFPLNHYKSTGIICQHSYKYALGLSLYYVPLIIYYVVVKMNSIQSHGYFLINHDLPNSVPKTVLEVYN